MSNVESRLEKADDIIRNHIMYAVGGGVIPIPLVDIAAVSAIQLDMLKQLAKVYEIEFSDESGKAYVSAIAGSSLARIGASLVKTIPGIGSLVGGISMPILSGASTYALGEVFKTHFESGGKLADISMDKAKDIFKREFEIGKNIAKEIKKMRDKKS